MPSLLKPKSNAREGDEKKTETAGEAAKTSTAAKTAAKAGEAPPSYEQLALDLNRLHLSAVSGDPDSSSCLAHLRFLFAIHALKEDVGYTDGLWGLWDARVLGDFEPKLPDGQKKPETEQERVRAGLSVLREKRWALFVARAVDRYAAWWDTLPKHALQEADMQVEGSPQFCDFPTKSQPMEWTVDILPPLDVMMVLHAHMLNPRDFLEDCMRAGVGGLWAAGFPWAVVHAAITDDFGYQVSDATQTAWVARTGRNWDNAEDPMAKDLRCPACRESLSVPWTTCSAAESQGLRADDLVGSGYGDGQFSTVCGACGITIAPPLLAVAKYVRDVGELLLHTKPMPGTLLRATSGKPERIEGASTVESRTFPNRLIKTTLASWSLELIQPGQHPPPTMETVRDAIEPVLRNNLQLRAINGQPLVNRRMFLSREARLAVRRMMSRYWDNQGPFALDLGGAVLRQGVFTDKMYRIDWLHSPAATETMDRLVTKYKRFVEIMGENPGQTCVPTLDIDLAWHTHQLSPPAYYAYTCEVTGRCSPRGVQSKFIDHDDKIDEDRLNLAFEFTSKVYQNKYDEVYSECTCWYCESIRAAHVNPASKLLHISRDDRIAEDFYQSGRAQLCPPDRSAHISAHNAVTFAVKSNVARAAHDRQMRHLESNYNKAVRRAERRGRKLPPRDQYYDHWGYAYFMYSPFIYPGYITPGIYYGTDPACIPTGSGTWGGCANGTCGNGIGSGACGGPGGCGPGGCGSASGMGAAGGCGGGCGSGGCGGGGGGGGGGGCGGGGGGCGGGGGGGC